MEVRKRVSLGGLWCSLYPILVYDGIQFLTGIIYGIVIVASVSVNSRGDTEEMIMRQVEEGTVLVVLLAAVVSIPLFGWMYYHDGQKRRRMGWNAEWYPLTETALLWAAVGGAGLALFGNNLLSLLPLAQWSDKYQDVSEALYAGNIWIRIASVGFFGPAVEELLMRGLLYQRFRAMMRPVTAIFWSAVVFGIFHGNIVQGLYAFLIGLFFGWLMERYQRVLVPMLAHMSANLLVVLLEDSKGLELIYGSVSAFWTVTLISGAVSVWAYVMLWDS